MIPQTVGREYDAGRVAPIECRRNDDLSDLEIKDRCFLMILVKKGRATFSAYGRRAEAAAPCVVCFDETEDPVLVCKKGLKCDSVYFDPTFLNRNMTFGTVRGEGYADIAERHDMFLMKPFTDHERFVYPLLGEQTESVRVIFDNLRAELEDQRDWYWSCRSRSYFMEALLILERINGLFDDVPGTLRTVVNGRLRRAVLYIESRYHEDVTLSDISSAAQLNVNSLNLLFREELGVTPMNYLLNHRIAAAKRKLEFTDLPVGEIAVLTGFKTASHFCRKFGETTGMTPTEFRKRAVEERKRAFAETK
ncbi:MAG: helix-turn-helix transcriptional regulator [Clostridia bacterium]|nr:helix-turn-helix transcriptional regulator [Clostridia bacterium]